MTPISEVAHALADRAIDVCRELLPAGKQQGNQWVVGDVSGAPGDSMFVELAGPKAGLWCDHADDSGGDMIDLVAFNRGISKGQAAAWGRQFLGLPADNSSPPPFDPLKFGFRRSADEPYRYPVAAWPYHDASGALIGYVVRFDNPDGSKDTLPLRPKPGADPATRAGWHYRGWKSPEPPPIFNLHRLAQHPDRPVLVVEGEKTAVAAAKLFPTHVVITWQGGSKAISRVDWSPLASRTDVTFWPDNDPPGLKAATYLKARFPHLKLVRPPISLPTGWDLADPIPPDISVQGLLDAAGDPPPSQPSQPDSPATPFRCLGHDDAGFHYLSFRSGRIVTLSAPEHTELNLQTVAGDDFWSDLSLQVGNPNRDSSGPDYKSIAKHLIGASYAAGHYDSDNVRGLGCWIEHPSDYPAAHRPSHPVVICHAGDRLYVDGTETDLHRHPSRFIYPSRKPFTVCLDHPATTDDARLLIEISNLFPWHETAWPWLLPAACFIAPICGALDWRPHAWLTGSKSAGKSWIYTNFIANLIGSAVIKALSTTTEAGLRQVIQADALPVIFDEIEAKDERSSTRIRNILELARQASSETGGSIFKGTALGTAKQYRIRSTFIFSSIGDGATEAADESRIARMELDVKRKSEANFTRIKQLSAATLFNPAWCQSIRARAILAAPAIRTSSNIFQSAIAHAAADSRKGQQYGTLAAGYWHLLHDSPPTSAQAAEFAAQHQWDHVGAGDLLADSDEQRCLDILLQTKVTLQDPQGHRFDRSIGELCEAVFSYSGESSDARDTLIRHGIYPNRSRMAIDVAIRHVELSRIYRHTPYAERWKGQLIRLTGATNSVYTVAGQPTKKAVRVPWITTPGSTDTATTTENHLADSDPF